MVQKSLFLTWVFVTTKQIYATKLASKFTLPVGFCLIGERCKLCEFIWFLWSDHMTYQNNMVMTTESEGNL